MLITLLLAKNILATRKIIFEMHTISITSAVLSELCQNVF